MTTIPRRRIYRGPALLSYGFRPFFLLGAIYAGLSVILWLPMFYGELILWTSFTPLDWHAHELLYGYLPAVITGFLLTAIPNWTGRLPIQGTPLLTLVVVWVAGRISITLSAQIGWLSAAIIDVAFLALVAIATAREIIAGKNWRNLRIEGMITLLIIGNIAFHVEAHIFGSAEYGVRVGIAAMVLLIMVIGGRIIPSFTHNWLVRENPGRLPVPFARLDVAVIGISAVVLALWILQPLGQFTATALALAGMLNIVRLARWAGDRTWRERLVLVLHVGYAFVPIGFLLASAAALEIVVAGAGIHTWTAGAAGTMTLAVMTRASLGHTGHTLTASTTTQAIYATIVFAAVTRICAALSPAWSEPLLQISAFAWIAAFFGFAGSFGPLLIAPKRSAETAR